MLTHSLNFFIVTKRISDRNHFCKWQFLYIVNFASGSFCWNYVTDTFYKTYAGDNVCWNYAGFETLLQLCMCIFCYSYVGGSFRCNHAYDRFYWNYTVRSCRTYASDSFWIEYISENSYSIYAGGTFCCNYAGGTFHSA